MSKKHQEMNETICDSQTGLYKTWLEMSWIAHIVQRNNMTPKRN